jgi:hypothetical protein
MALLCNAIVAVVVRTMTKARVYGYQTLQNHFFNEVI